MSWYGAIRAVRMAAGVGGLALILAAAEPSSPPAAAQSAPTDSAASRLERYFEDRFHAFRTRLSRYNEDHVLARSQNGDLRVHDYDWRIHRLDDGLIELRVTLTAGRYHTTQRRYTGLFEVAWRGEQLAILNHRAVPKELNMQAGSAGDAGKDCVWSYYSPKPCPGVLREWEAFTEAHDLPMSPATARIFEGYKHNDTRRADRLLARLRGEPAGRETSAFGAQREVAAMNLRRLATGRETDCSIDPFAPNPCQEVVAAYRRFTDTHGLGRDRRTGQMFADYVRGDFQRADVVFALETGREVPDYGYRPTAIAADAGRYDLADRDTATEAGGCSPNPYDPKPCPDAPRAWRDFAERYALADTAEHARVFEAYVEGRFEEGDRRLAAAKNVSLEQLQTAAGLAPTELVIEVYPGSGGDRRGEVN